MAKSVYEELYNLAYGWISYMNNEQVTDYTELKLAAYIAGMEATPFKEIATGMMTEELFSGGKSSQRSRDIIGAYAGFGEAINNTIVEHVITAAISDFLNTGTQAVSEAVKKGNYLHCCDVPYQAGKTFAVTGTDSKGNFVLISLDILQQKESSALDFTDFWRVSPKYLEQHFTTL